MLLSLKVVLLRRDMSQLQLARALRMSPAKVSRIIRGRIKAKPQDVAKIASFLELPASALASLDRSKKSSTGGTQ